MRSRSVLLLLLLVGAAPAACFSSPFEGEAPDHGSARLRPLPAPTVVGANPTGDVALGLAAPRDGMLFVPASYDPSVPMPLLVLLHGAGGASSYMLDSHRQLADSVGVILLALDSRAFTWDAIIARFDRDITFIDAALANVLGRYNVDRSRLGVGGFSDGASYAMALGPANGDIFRKVILHAPGIRYRVRLVGHPRFYVTHGTEDAILPFLATRLSFVPFLRATGAEVTFVEWPGPHAMSLARIRESLIWLAEHD